MVKDKGRKRVREKAEETGGGGGLRRAEGGEAAPDLGD